MSYDTRNERDVLTDMHFAQLEAVRVLKEIEGRLARLEAFIKGVECTCNPHSGFCVIHNPIE